MSLLEILIAAVLAVPIGLWIGFYPNPYHRKGRFRKPSREIWPP